MRADLYIFENILLDTNKLYYIIRIV